jgi:hypothetical protein
VSAAALAAVANGRQLANDILELRQQWRDRVKARADSSAWRLADRLFAQPVINSDRATTDRVAPRRPLERPSALRWTPGS